MVAAALPPSEVKSTFPLLPSALSTLTPMSGQVAEPETVVSSNRSVAVPLPVLYSWYQASVLVLATLPGYRVWPRSGALGRPIEMPALVVPGAGRAGPLVQAEVPLGLML